MKKIILVDSPIEFDNRVKSSFCNVTDHIIDIRKTPCGIICFISGFLLFLNHFFNSVININKNKSKLATFAVHPNSNNIFFGLKATIYWTIRAYSASLEIKKIITIQEDNTYVIHGHDLYASLAIALVSCKEFNFIYEAHEFEINRNRKNGLLRLLTEFNYEKKVLKKCSKLIVVNHKIKNLMQKIYSYKRASEVVYNNFYKVHEISIKRDYTSSPAIVYVGKGTIGRMLEDLDKPKSNIQFDIFCFFLNDSIPRHLNGKNWHIGAVDYEDELFGIITKRRCLMWCCLESQSLSYKLSLPNKFFQALSAGMPIIASENTYLAEIVSDYEIGTIYNGKNLNDIYQLASQDIFLKWIKNVYDIRKKFILGEINL